MIEDLVRIWPLVLALVFIIALVVRLDSASKEHTKKITTLFDMMNEAIRRELQRKDKD